MPQLAALRSSSNDPLGSLGSSGDFGSVPSDLQVSLFGGTVSSLHPSILSPRVGGCGLGATASINIACSGVSGVCGSLAQTTAATMYDKIRQSISSWATGLTQQHEGS